MEDYKKRFIKEYEELDERTSKLLNMLNKWAFAVVGSTKNNPDELTDDEKKKALGFVPSCDFDLLQEQVMAMTIYKLVLKKRAKIENIDLSKYEGE